MSESPTYTISCCCAQFAVEEGDVVVVATDGLWDNLFDDAIAALVAQYAPGSPGAASPARAAQLAQALASAAHAAARDPNARWVWVLVVCWPWCCGPGHCMLKTTASMQGEG